MADLKWRVVQREDQREFGKAHLVLICPKSGGECWFALKQEPASNNGQTKRWQWDGNIEQPTITPSIDCQGGCGLHFTIAKGVVYA